MKFMLPSMVIHNWPKFLFFPIQWNWLCPLTFLFISLDRHLWIIYAQACIATLNFILFIFVVCVVISTFYTLQPWNKWALHRAFCCRSLLCFPLFLPFTLYRYLAQSYLWILPATYIFRHCPCPGPWSPSHGYCSGSLTKPLPIPFSMNSY